MTEKLKYGKEYNWGLCFNKIKELDENNLKLILIVN